MAGNELEMHERASVSCLEASEVAPFLPRTHEAGGTDLAANDLLPEVPPNPVQRGAPGADLLRWIRQPPTHAAGTILLVLACIAILALSPDLRLAMINFFVRRGPLLRLHAPQPPVIACSHVAVPVAKVDDLTLDEKIGQMTQVDKNALTGRHADISKYHIGSVLSGGGGAPDWGGAAQDWADMVDYFQMQTKNTRLQIPILYGVDAVHGHNNVKGATIFPHHIGLGASRNPVLVRHLAAAVAKEVAATGARWSFSPAVSVCRDARWGRCYESFSQDPAIVQALAAAEIDGFQTKAADPAVHVPGGTFVAACAKHFVADGGTTGGVDRGNTELAEAELRAVHLAPYRTAIAHGVLTVMASYSSWNGMKMHAQRHLLTAVLKEELGFEGLVVSDWEAVQQLPGAWHNQVRTAINAGIDMVMVPWAYRSFISTLKKEVTAGRVSLARIDDAVTRILRVKQRLGLFEAGGACAARELLPAVGCRAHRQLAREAARESLVLLHNRRRRAFANEAGSSSIFPLPVGGRILVGGSHAHNVGLQCGGWTISWQGGSGNITAGTTVLEGIRAATAGVAGSVEFAERPTGHEVADLAVLAVGEAPYAEYFGDTKGVPTLSRDAQETVRKVCTSMMCVVVLVTGRPLQLAGHSGGSILEATDAVVAAWLPGSEGGAAIADLLFGQHDFSGRTPMSWPAAPHQQGSSTASPLEKPLFGVGYGLDKKGQLLHNYDMEPEP